MGRGLAYFLMDSDNPATTLRMAWPLLGGVVSLAALVLVRRCVSLVACLFLTAIPVLVLMVPTLWLLSLALQEDFVKVRYYGFLSSGCRQRLATIRQQLDSFPAYPSLVPEGKDVDTQSVDQPTDDPVPNPVLFCPSCGQVMQRRTIPRPQGRCPP